MHDFTTSAEPSKSLLLANNLAIEEACNNANYNIWIPATDMAAVTVSGAAPTFYTAGTNYAIEPAYWEFAAGGPTHRVAWYVRRPPAWKNGMVYVKLHIGSDVNDGNPWVMGASANLIEDSVAPGTGFTAVGRPSPTLANSITTVTTLDVTVFTNLIPNMTTRYIGEVYRVDRRSSNVADTHAGDLRLYGAEMIYFEKIKQTGEKHTPEVRQEA